MIRGQERIPVNVSKMIQKGDVSQNVKLQPGDTIVVPNAEYVYVHGEVKAPGQVKYTKDLTIMTAIAAAGGLTPAASNSVTVLRGEGAKREVLKVNVGDIMSDPSESADVPLKPNDIIVVSSEALLEESGSWRARWDGECSWSLSSCFLIAFPALVAAQPAQPRPPLPDPDPSQTPPPTPTVPPTPPRAR